MEAVCQRYSAMHARQNDDFGVEISRLKETATLLSYLRNRKSANKELDLYVERLNDNTAERLRVAEEASLCEMSLSTHLFCRKTR